MAAWRSCHVTMCDIQYPCANIQCPHDNVDSAKSIDIVMHMLSPILYLWWGKAKLTLWLSGQCESINGVFGYHYNITVAFAIKLYSLMNHKWPTDCFEIQIMISFQGYAYSRFITWLKRSVMAVQVTGISILMKSGWCNSMYSEGSITTNS